MKRAVLAVIALVVGGAACFVAFALYESSGEPGGNHANIIAIKLAVAGALALAVFLAYRALRPSRRS